ncbi:hypothetical protein Ae201684P_007775 [Aphanomyces euteiches]|uniref:RxLR effector protein n=1 Tax=Aphanomyces euteiches TaxID=100861 RepID=A0A6G0W3V8_9STRA|nr:hypothetical protein Ae201684_019020 [Aphanomyces euteiches]KAH9089607.1 hypothetical protein Ae201684P_007775 [Aphanomyces euteiches]
MRLLLAVTLVLIALTPGQSTPGRGGGGSSPRQQEHARSDSSGRFSNIMWQAWDKPTDPPKSKSPVVKSRVAHVRKSVSNGLSKAAQSVSRGFSKAGGCITACVLGPGSMAGKRRG